jgi:hypothetical protein
MHNNFNDDHNAKQYSPISLEDIWATKWPSHVFAFCLSIMLEVNIMLVVQFGGSVRQVR